MKKRIYQFVISPRPSTAASIGILRNFLRRAGLQEEDISESLIDGKASLSVFFAGKERAVSLHEKLRRMRLKNIDFRLRPLESEDWQDKWKEDFKPFRLTRFVDIAPLWHKKNYRSPRRIIYIDTVLAFGTGLHETTRYMARFIERCRGRFDSFLDVGTGTGILSALAFVYGASRVEAIDIDKNCLNVAKTNLSANGFKFDTIKAIDFARLKTKAKFDFIAANLISQDLIRFRRKLCALVRKGKYLAVSGISRENLPVLQKAFRGLPLRCLKVCKGRKWTAVLFQRR